MLRVYPVDEYNKKIFGFTGNFIIYLHQCRANMRNTFFVYRILPKYDFLTPLVAFSVNFFFLRGDSEFCII